MGTSDSPLSPLRVYLHAAAMGDFWREIVAELVGQLDGSGLYDAAEQTTLVIVGDGPTRYLSGRGRPKARVIQSGQGIDAYEYPTLAALWHDARANPTGAVLYIHTKGASSPPSESGQGAYEGRRFRGYWRQMMSYHLVTRWREAVTALCHHQADAVGCFLTHQPFPHFAGNFWWARAEYLATLPEPGPREGMHPRLWAEFWLGSGGGRLHEIYGLPVDLPLAFCEDEYRG